MKKRVLWLAGVLVLAVLALVVGLLVNGGKATSMHLVRTQGTVSVQDGQGAAMPVRENLSLYDGHNVRTETLSYAWIDLDKVKLTKLDESSDVTVHRTGKHLELEVNAGSLFFNVTEPLQDDESMEIRTSNLFVGIRGTCGWVQVVSETCMRLGLLEGEVVCSVRSETGEELVSHTVTPGQMAELIYDGENSSITVMELPAIPDFVQAELDQTEQPQQTQAPSAEALYQPILDQYAAAMADETQEFPDLNELMLHYYHQYGGNTGFYYAYYDIDGNGTEELLIGSGPDTEFVRIADLYGIQNQAPYKLIDEDTLGDRSWLEIYPDGSMVLMGSGGADYMHIDVYRFGEDGVLEQPETIQDGSISLSSVGKTADELVTEYMGAQQPVTEFDWKPITPAGEAASSGSAQDYLGVYINGQDWNAGTLTITERDAESVTVRLEAFTTQSDQALSTVFEGVGRAADDGLVVDISGGQVRLVRGEFGLWVEADSALQEAWASNPHVFAEEYLFRAMS